MYLSWIVFIKDGQENTIPGKPDHFINFRKRYIGLRAQVVVYMYMY